MPVQLQGADLSGAELQLANLFGAKLQGANLFGAELQAAVLIKAELQGAVLRTAALHGTIVYKSDTELVDLRSARWAPLHDRQLTQLRELLGETIADTKWRDATLEHIERAAYAGLAPTIFESCLSDPEVTPGLKCQRQWLPGEVEAFRSDLFPVLEKLACESVEIAGGLNRIRGLAKREEEERQGQSGAGKPADEVPAPPNPPPANTPETL